MASEQRCLLPAFRTCQLHKCKGAIDRATDLELIQRFYVNCLGLFRLPIIHGRGSSEVLPLAHALGLIVCHE